MVIEITYDNEKGKTTKRIIKNICEIQDNDGELLVIRSNNRLCEYFEFVNIKELKIYKG